MDTLIKDGDFYRGARGMPVKITGADELIQRAVIRLTVRLGSFAADKTLGSELYRLGRTPERDLDAAALNLTRMALLPLSEITVESAVCTRFGERLTLKTGLRVRGEYKNLEVNIGR